MTRSGVALPDDYAEVLVALKRRVRAAQIQAHRLVNTELLGLYWAIGDTILDRQAVHGWGAKVIDRLAEDLRVEFPEMTGLSRSNLHYMRQMAATWSQAEIVQQPVGQLPWGHVTVLLDKLHERADRDWYATQAAAGGWSRAVLLNQIKADALGRTGAALTNFATQLPAPDSDLAQQLVKDPYVFDFLNLTQRVAERELEDALLANLQQFLLELGHGFAFVARQYRFTVAGDDFVIDLLFFNFQQNRFVVFELKVDKFSPATPDNWACTCPGSSRTSPRPGTGRRSGSWSARTATRPWCTTPWPARPRRWRSRPTHTTNSPPKSSRPYPATPTSAPSSTTPSSAAGR